MFSRRAVVFLGVGVLSALMVVPLLWPDSGPASAGAVGQVGAPAGFTPAPPPAGAEPPLGRYTEPQYPIAPPEPAAASLVGGPEAPAISTGFAGISNQPDGSGFIWSPPDTHAAAGPDRIVEIVNGHVAIYSKTGTIIAGGDSGPGEVDLNTFCQHPAPSSTNYCFDPKVIYDQASARFVAVVLEGTTAATSFLHVMVSKTSAPTNLTTDWDKFRQAANTTFGGTPGWFDYPGLGVSPSAVVVTGNIFSDPRVFLGTTIRVYDKTELYDQDATATFVDIDTSFLAGGGGIQPAHHFGSPPAGTFYLFQRWNSTYLRVVALTGVPGSPVLNGTICVGPPPCSLLLTANQGVAGLCGLQAPQLGTLTKKLDPVCPRMMNAVWRDGSLWGSLAGSDVAETRTIVQWFEVETNGFPTASPTVRQHGTIDGGIGEYTFMPSIAVDNCENVALTYTQSSLTRYPEMRYTGRLAGAALNMMQSPSTAKTSIGFHDDYIPGPPERWGDYSATVLDPTDQSFWIANEYVSVAASGAGNDSVWGTWLAKFTFGCTLGVGPTPTPTKTPTPTPTPTPKNPAADYDGDTIPNSSDPDDDNDGCPDVDEQQTAIGSQISGGRRDKKNPWDYFNPTHDGQNRVDDILKVIQQYNKDDADGNPGLPPYSPGYTPDTDRTYIGPNLWNLGPPNGLQRVDDILAQIYQYNHDCP